MHRPFRVVLAALVAWGAMSMWSSPAAAGEGLRAEVLDRFGGDADGDGLLDGPTNLSPEQPGVFPVLLRPPAEVCRDRDAAWTVDGRSRDPDWEAEDGTCRVVFHVRGEGGREFEVESGDATFAEIVEIDDALIVALGDSVASGEGNPLAGGKWLDPGCHRSPAAGFEQAARVLAGVDSGRSITFVSLACSGAQVKAGLLEPYEGIEETANAPYDPQVTRLGRLAEAAGENPDAILISAGANDLGFSDVVEACALGADCRERHHERVLGALEELDGRYDELGRRLDQIAPETPVLITEYFDPTRDERGEFCTRSLLGTSRPEAQWAYHGLLRPLNAEIAAAAVRNEWRLVRGIEADFGTHGYCAGDAERWIRRLGGSLYSQQGVAGTFHPNEKGHTAIAARVVAPLGSEVGITAPPPDDEAPTSDGDESTLGQVGDLLVTVAKWALRIAGVLLLLAALAWLISYLRGATSFGDLLRRVLIWPLAALALAGLVLWLVVIRVAGGARVLAVRLFRLLRPGEAEGEEAAQHDLKGIPVPRNLRDLGVVLGVLVALVVLVVVFSGVIGRAILWVRFYQVHLPADQAVDAVGEGELVATGSQALAIFAVLGILAVVVTWLLDPGGKWNTRATRRGLLTIALAELAIAVSLGDFRTEHALWLLAQFAFGGVLVYFLIDRAFAGDSMARDPRSLWEVAWERLARLCRSLFGNLRRGSLPASVFLFVWRLLPLALLALAVYESFVADGEDRRAFVVAPLIIAAVLFVLPRGIAAEPTAVNARGEEVKRALDPPRIALAAAGVVCIAVLVARDEPWLAASAAIAVVLATTCLVIARATAENFAPFGIAVLASVAVFGATATILRGLDSPEVQPLAVTTASGKPFCGIYVGESDGRLWIGRIELSEHHDVREPDPDEGRIFPVDSDEITGRSLGPLQPVGRAERQAVALRDELLIEEGSFDRRAYEPTCAPPKPEPVVRTTWQRRIAERYQPELVLDREDGFWPIPVTTLFAMSDRRAAACRLVAAEEQGDCVRLTTPGAFPWSGGMGEAIEYPAADTSIGSQRRLMTEALGSVDPAATAHEYFLLSGAPDDDRADSLQYWFFYSFNYQPVNLLGGLDIAGYHEGDFESIGLLLSAETHRPRYIWMARHADEGRVFPWEDDAVAKPDDHAQVFVAKGSHASYESCQRQRRPEGPRGLIDDRPTCEEFVQMRLAPEVTPLTDLSRVGWGCWAGMFGHRSSGRGIERLPHLVGNGPRSPLWQQKFDGIAAEPCRGVDDPGGRDGIGEEVLEKADGVPARLRGGAGSLEALIDECADWEKYKPADGAYMVVCDETALREYVESGLEDPGPAGLRIDSVEATETEVGQVMVPAVRQDVDSGELAGWRITAARPSEASVYASCRSGNEIVVARFDRVRIDPRWPLHISDGDPAAWKLRREDGRVVARAVPQVFASDGESEVKAPHGATCGA